MSNAQPLPVARRRALNELVMDHGPAAVAKASNVSVDTLGRALLGRALYPITRDALERGCEVLRRGTGAPSVTSANPGPLAA